MKKALIASLLITTTFVGCGPSEPVVEYRSPNAISYKYNAYGMSPTLTLQVRDLAQTHCEQYGKNAEYVGAKIPNVLATAEVHEFTCNVNKVIVKG